MLPVVIAAALAAGALVRAAKGRLRSERPRTGYCTECGREGRHDFHEDGLTWKRTGPIAVLTGGLGTALAGLVTRSIYRCAACRQLTVPCRMPACSGMARSTTLYDYELCGRCMSSNDEHAQRAAKERTQAENAKLVEVMKAHEAAIQSLERELADARAAKAADSSRIAGLKAQLDHTRETVRALRRQLGLPPAVPA